VNPISALSWIWKALRGRSVTFAALFAFTLAGFSVLAWIKAALQAAGASWLVLLVLPTVLLAVLARKEMDWIPDEDVRRRWARGLIFGSLFAAIASAVLLPSPPGPEASEGAPVRKIGPRSK
jgi:membrane protease YdiL (CAAX protease family)